MDKVAAKLMATLAKYQLRHGEFPNVWYVSPEEMHVLTGQEELEEIVMPSPVDRKSVV